jgi:hypothetical protein
MLAVGFLGKIAGVKPEIPSVSLEGWEIHQLKQDSKYFFKPNEGLVEASLEVEPLEVEGFRYVFRLDGLRVVPSITFDDFMIPRIVGRNNRILASMLIDKIGMLKNPR